MRKRRVIPDVTYEDDLKPGNIVAVTSKTTFNGTAIGAILPPQKWCDGGIPVITSHDTYLYLCIRTQNGDTIKKVN